MRIGFDIDGVLANFIAAYQGLIIAQTGRDLFGPTDIFDPPCWDWPQFRGYTDAEMKAVWAHIKNSPTFWATLMLDSGMPALQKRWTFLPSQGHDVVFATARVGANVLAQTRGWLEMYGLTNPVVEITADKEAFCRAYAVDLYIDDRLDNIQSVAAGSPSTRAYLLNRRYNALTSAGLPVQDTPGYRRVLSVEDFFRLESL